MASNWIRLESASRDRGWAGRLPASQYAAWVKFLLEVKANGKLGGRIAADYFPPRVLRNLRISHRSWDYMMAAAEKNEAVRTCGDEIIVVNWNQYQEDPTHANRQREYRERQGAVTGVTSPPSRDDSDADVTGRDGTGHTPPKPPSEFPSPESLSAFTLAYFQVFPRREQEKTAPLRLRGWDADGKHRSWHAWAISQSSELLLSLTATDLKRAKAWAVDRGMAWGPYTLVLWLEDEGKRAAQQTRPAAYSLLVQEFYRQPSAVTRKYLVAHDNDFEKAAEAWQKDQETKA